MIRSGDERVEETLAQLNLEFERGDNGDISVGITDRDLVLAVLQGLKERGAAYREIYVSRPNLEEVFLNLTGETLGDD